LIIPFRHNTSGHNALAPDMPKHVYARAKVLSPSYVLPPGTKKPALRRSGSGHLVPQRSYEWGERLPAGMLGPNPKGKTDRYAGMVRMNTSAGKAKSSEFLTFRTMSENSPGWVIPPRPGLWIAREVTQKMRPVIEEMIRKAVAE
jgi:hypothetical protein